MNCAGIWAVHKRTSPTWRRTSIDWNDRVISYARRKTGSRAFIHFGPALETILRSLPTQGLCIPEARFAEGKVSGAGIQTPLRRFGDLRRHSAFLPLCLGGAGENVRLSRAIRARSARTQQQGHSSRLRAQSASQTAFAGKLRKAKRGRPHCSVAPAPAKARSQWSLVFGGWLSVRLSRNRHSRLRQ